MRLKTSTVMFSFVFLFLFVGLAMAKDGSKGEGLPGEGMVPRATEYNWQCKIPYNIDADGFWTGLHIMHNGVGNEELRFSFFNGPTYYSQVFKVISPQGWTGYAQNLLPNPGSFQSPSYIWISCNKEFTVTQFVGQNNGQGFSHQTFFSFPYSQGWPYTDVPELIL